MVGGVFLVGGVDFDFVFVVVLIMGSEFLVDVLVVLLLWVVFLFMLFLWSDESFVSVLFSEL